MPDPKKIFGDYDNPLEWAAVEITKGVASSLTGAVSGYIFQTFFAGALKAFGIESSSNEALITRIQDLIREAVEEIKDEIEKSRLKGELHIANGDINSLVSWMHRFYRDYKDESYWDDKYGNKAFLPILQVKADSLVGFLESIGLPARDHYNFVISIKIALNMIEYSFNKTLNHIEDSKRNLRIAINYNWNCIQEFVKISTPKISYPIIDKYLYLGKDYMCMEFEHGTYFKDERLVEEREAVNIEEEAYALLEIPYFFAYKIEPNPNKRAKPKHIISYQTRIPIKEYNNAFFLKSSIGYDSHSRIAGKIKELFSIRNYIIYIVNNNTYKKHLNKYQKVLDIWHKYISCVDVYIQNKKEYNTTPDWMQRMDSVCDSGIKIGAIKIIHTNKYVAAEYGHDNRGQLTAFADKLVPDCILRLIYSPRVIDEKERKRIGENSKIVYLQSSNGLYVKRNKIDSCENKDLCMFELSANGVVPDEFIMVGGENYFLLLSENKSLENTIADDPLYAIPQQPDIIKGYVGIKNQPVRKKGNTTELVPTLVYDKDSKKSLLALKFEELKKKTIRLEKLRHVNGVVDEGMLINICILVDGKIAGGPEKIKLRKIYNFREDKDCKIFQTPSMFYASASFRVAYAKSFIVDEYPIAYKDQVKQNYTYTKDIKIGNANYLLEFKVEDDTLKQKSIIGQKKYSYKWTTGWTTAEFNDNGDLLFLLKEKGGTVHVNSVGNGEIGITLEQQNWSDGWTTCKFYRIDNRTLYLFLLKAGTGEVHIHEMLNGKVGREVKRYGWTSGWTTAEFYTIGKQTFLFLLKVADGAIHIHKMNDGVVGDEIQNLNWGPGWTIAKPYQVNNSQYFFAHKQNGGQSKVLHVNSEGLIDKVVAEYSWGTGYRAVEFYGSYLFRMSLGGAIDIFQIEPDGKIGKKVDSADWGGLGFDHMKIFGWGKPHLFVMNSQSGDVEIHGLL